ncbi:hypothetical protein LIN78_03250 [Leeia sp. TBRC 13508]|uniref:Transmembrane protein n=1 Tax=Leeia speluncae TaxID=2884804 RepID=A0ABS8D2Y0_9NEIS|nr:BPSS1780 family membrane protein [Leeia speluncae]MCB6182566.1 hypothetical protein [Leeia speluncae]
MSSQNPYQPPQAVIEERNAYESIGNLNLTGNTVSAGDGVSWIGEGWALFKAAPGIWIANLIIFFIVMAVAGIIPFLNFLIQPIVSAVLIAGFMVGCRAIDDGESLSVNHLFAGLQTHASQLIVIGVIQIVLSIVMMAVMGVLAMIFIGGSLFTGGLSALSGNNPAGMFALMSGLSFSFLILIFVSFIIGFMVYSCILFAPVLVVLHDVAPMDAIKASFAGVWKNILPFIVFGIISGIMLIVSMLPFGLGLLISIPVLIGSLYACYKQIYL